MSKHLGLSENVVYPIVPNGFADHYPCEKWLFHWDTQHFQVQTHFSPSNPAITPIEFRPCSCPRLRPKEGDLAAVAQRLMLVQRLERAAEDDVFSCNWLMLIDVNWMLIDVNWRICYGNMLSFLRLMGWE